MKNNQSKKSRRGSKPYHFVRLIQHTESKTEINCKIKTVLHFYAVKLEVLHLCCTQIWECPMYGISNYVTVLETMSEIFHT